MAGEPLFEMEFGQMAGEEDEDVIVSLPPAEGEVKVTKVGEKATPTEDPVEDLKGQFAAMTQRVTAAERTAQAATQQAQEATQRAAKAEVQVVSSQLDTVLSGLAAAEAESKSAKQAMVTAHEAGDFVAVADAQERIADARARVQRLQEAKADLEDSTKRKPDEQVRRQPQRDEGTVDPVETFARGMSQRSAAWIRSHPECITDPKLNARMLAAHNLAIADDVKVDSDEYFRRIDDGIKVSGGKPAAPAGDGRRPSSAAAPASGSSGGLNGGGQEVRLTKREALAATDGTLVWGTDSPDGKFKKGDNLGLAEMARRKHYGKLAGLYDKTYNE
jgi:hypothetical protein